MIKLPGYSIIIFSIVFALASAYYDSRVLKKKYIYNHEPRAYFRAIIFIGFSTYQHILIPKPEVFLLIGLGCALMASIFWMVFDIALNVFRGLNPFYLGQTAELDKAFNTSAMQMLTKGFVLLVVSFSYYSIVQI